MRKPENKTKIATIALILLLTVSAIIVALPAATAQTTKTTYAFLGAVPNPVGVNQQVLLHVGITQELQTVEMGWEDLTVTIERPDDTTETLTNIRTDSTGGTGEVYTPTMVGTYTLQTHFPEQVTTDDKRAGSMFTGFVPVGTVMLASVSERLELVVQDEAIPYYPGQSLPNEYWTRPIDAQLREWSPIAGNWIWGAGMFGGAAIPNRFAPCNDYAPESAHILWTKSMTSGGLAGGATGEHAFECGDAYEGKFPGPLIIAGKLYYTAGGSRGLEPVVTHCVDLHTGEELWSKVFLDNRTLSFGQLFYWDSFNYHAVFPYLWVTTGGFTWFGPPAPESWYAFDAFTGDWRYTIENVPSGTNLYGPKGEIYKLNVNLRNGWMALWDSSKVVNPQNTGSPDDGSWGNVAHGRTFDATANTTAAQVAWIWNKTIPTGLSGNVQVAEFGDRVVGGIVTPTKVESWSLSLEPGKEGKELFRETWNAPSEWTTGNLTVSWAGSSLKEGVFVAWVKETRQYYGFSTATGKFLWKTEPQHYLNFHIATETAIVYGKLYSAGVSGIVYCYDLKTGNRLWTYSADDPYQEILWTNNWWTQILFITDGKIYVGHSEHSPIDPKPRGAPFTCLNATTGDVIWRADGLFRQTHWGGTAIIGDSIIATQDSYDQRVYAIGKGPSEITASIKDNVVPLGSSVLIDGTVMDISPGTEDYALTARFPNGVPAVSDESMSDWMLHVYKQFPKPADAVGVSVMLEAIDPNNNYQDLGTATSDGSGNYGFTFEPEVPGQYMIIATFYGSEAYYGSTTTTYLTVDPAPEPYPTDPGYQGPTASDVAQNVLDRLPDDPTAGEIAQEVLDQMPAYPDYPDYPEAPEAPEYTTIDLAIIAAVVVVAALVIYTLYTVRKQRK